MRITSFIIIILLVFPVAVDCKNSSNSCSRTKKRFFLLSLHFPPSLKSKNDEAAPILPLVTERKKKNQEKGHIIQAVNEWEGIIKVLQRTCDHRKQSKKTKIKNIYIHIN